MTLIEFLKARIGEDEAVVARFLARWREAGMAPEAVGADFRIHWSTERMEIGLGVGRFQAECAAKRAIIVLLAPEVGRGYGTSEQAETVLATMALPYADHPHFREEWRP